MDRPLNIADFFNVRAFRSREGEIRFIFEALDLLDGFMMEFGVWRGGSIRLIAKQCRGRVGPSRTVWGFDSFKGLPEPWGRWHREHALSNPPEVPENVELVIGLFQDTLTEWKQAHPGQVSFLNLDADLYSSTIYVLNELNDRIVPGTVIRFDELTDWTLVENPRTPVRKRWIYTNWRDHEWKALNEWVEKFNRKVSPLARNMSWGSTVRVIQ